MFVFVEDVIRLGVVAGGGARSCGVGATALPSPQLAIISRASASGTQRRMAVRSNSIAFDIVAEIDCLVMRYDLRQTSSSC
jgi:hypothetical protein